MEDALAASELRWRFAIEGNGDGLWDWDAQTNEVFFSPCWKSMLGYEDHELEGSFDTWSSRVHPEDLDHALDELRRHIEGATDVYRSEHRLRHKDGTWRWILDRGKVLTRTPDGKPLRVVGTHTDITGSKETMLLLRAMNERLEAALAKVKQLEGILPICSHCKRIRDDEGVWRDVAVYVRDHSNAEFSHGICPVCLALHYGAVGDR